MAFMGLLGCGEMYLFLENKRDIMSSHYLDKDAEDALRKVIEFYKIRDGIEITFSQAVMLMYSDYKVEISYPKGADKQ